MEPEDFTDITRLATERLLKEHGTFLVGVDMGNAQNNLYAVESFYVEYVDYGDNTHDVFAYYDSPRLDKFLRQMDLRELFRG